MISRASEAALVLQPCVCDDYLGTDAGAQLFSALGMLGA